MRPVKRTGEARVVSRKVALRHFRKNGTQRQWQCMHTRGNGALVWHLSFGSAVAGIHVLQGVVGRLGALLWVRTACSYLCRPGVPRRSCIASELRMYGRQLHLNLCGRGAYSLPAHGDYIRSDDRLNPRFSPFRLWGGGQ